MAKSYDRRKAGSSVQRGVPKPIGGGRKEGPPKSIEAPGPINLGGAHAPSEEHKRKV